MTCKRECFLKLNITEFQNLYNRLIGHYKISELTLKRSALPLLSVVITVLHFLKMNLFEEVRWYLKRGV